MDWWSLFRTVTVLHLLSSTEQSEAQNRSKSDAQGDMTNAFMDAVGIKTRMCDQTPPPSCSGPPKEWRRPICKEKVGCDRPLNCFNYSSLTESGRVFQVKPSVLEQILENPAVTNTCAVVMVYASWCPYSVDFARQFNALGRSFKELPVVALDFAESDL